MLSQEIQKSLDAIIHILHTERISFSMENYKKIKSLHSSSVVASKLGLNIPALSEFEEAIRQFFAFKDDSALKRLACFRISLWLEMVTRNLNLPFNIDEALSNEELAIKQVRALELMIRDVVTGNLGGKENVLEKLLELFKQDVVDKWLKSADQTGVLSGTTFSELSNIFLDKNIFKSVEDIFNSSSIKLSKSTRDSLRYILEDIRVIRNAIAHNKQISKVQIEALNEYYCTIARLLAESKTPLVDPKQYLDMNKANMESFITGLKEDNKAITGDLGTIKEDVKEVIKDTGAIRKRTKLLVGGVAVIILITVSILLLLNKQNSSVTEMGKDIKDVKEIVTGDAELKNMSSTEDLTATKELNERTKNKNAKRIAILYFDNSGGEPSMDKLKKGLADMLITDLSNIHMLNIVERDKLESILKEQKLNNSKEFDPSTASKVGKLLGAEIILTGGYFDMMGSLRIDARFIDVESGKILKSDGVDGQTSSFFKMQKQLSWKILKNMDTKITNEEKKELEADEKTKAISLDDLNEYSRALDLYDQGKNPDAKSIAEKLLMNYPDFAPLKKFLNKM
jgi:TolB-like protein